MKILEFGQSFSIAYAGMVLAEQGHDVTRWMNPNGAPDLVESYFLKGPELWKWLTEGKTIATRAARDVTGLEPGEFDAVIDNISGDTWEKWGVDCPAEAERLGVTWVSLRDDLGGRSFDIIAQARAWGDHAGYIPFYVGDTASGLWVAFKVLAAPHGHYVIGQATCLAKLVEGELVVPATRNGQSAPFEMASGVYGPDGDGVSAIYPGGLLHEPYRDDTWRREHLPNRNGRYLV